MLAQENAWLQEGRGGGLAPELPAGDEGAKPPASPNVLHWVGWLLLLLLCQ